MRRLPHRITIQSPAESRDSTGAVLVTWANFATVWASIEPVSGREYFAASQVQSSTDARIRIRYLSGVNQRMRVVYGAEVYDIGAVIEINHRGRETHLMCTRRQAEGFR